MVMLNYPSVAGSGGGRLVLTLVGGWKLRGQVVVQLVGGRLSNMVGGGSWEVVPKN